LREFLFDVFVHPGIFQLGRTTAGLAARVGQPLGLLRSVAALPAVATELARDRAGVPVHQFGNHFLFVSGLLQAV
jgi:hypothetical protein